MKIKETIERECCKPQDLRPVHGTPMSRISQPEYVFCIHCGRHLRQVQVRDDDGPNWEYRPWPMPWNLEPIKEQKLS